MKELLKEAFGQIVQPVGLAPGQVATGISDFFQKGAMPADPAEYEKIFGTPEEFLERYKIFQLKYDEAIQKRLDLGRVNRMEAKSVSQRGIIDLNMFDYGTRDQLETFLKQDVFKLNEFVRSQGLFGFEFPSSNAYRAVFRADIDTAGGIIHPAQLLMSGQAFNFNPEKSGLGSISMGTKFQSYQDMMNQWLRMSQVPEEVNPAGKSVRLMRQIDPFAGMTEGQKVLTIDVETTGKSADSMVRSFAAAEIEKRSGIFTGPTTVINQGFASKKFNGMVVPTLNEGTRTLNEFIAGVEYSGAALGEMGDNYLSEVNKLFERMLDADRVAGHNVMFDVDMLVRTAQAQEGYSSKITTLASGRKVTASEMVDQLNERIGRGNFMVDTLESTRAYLQDAAREAISIVSAQNREDAFLSNLLSEAAAENVKLGGAVKYAGVTEFVTNTNFFELIQNQPGSEAAEVIDKIFQGSHIAETDVHLQSYIGKFLHEKAVTGELKLKVLAERNNETTELGNRLRERMLKSSAITPTTNIADINTVSQTVLDYLKSTDSAKRGMETRISTKEVIDLGLLQTPTGQAQNLIGQYRVDNLTAKLQSAGTYSVDTLQAEAEKLTGTLRFHGGNYVFAIGDEVNILDQSKTVNYLTGLLQQAENEVRNPIPQPTTVLDRIAQPLSANDRIISTGISFGTQSRAEHLVHMKNVADMDISGMSTLERYSTVLGSAYEDLGTGFESTNIINTLREVGRPGGLSSVFARGIKNYTSQDAAVLAQKFAAVGDPYAKIVDPSLRAVSTGLAESTIGFARSAVQAAQMNIGISDDVVKGLKYLDYGEAFAEMGISYGQAQSTMRVFDLGTSNNLVTSKPMVQPEIIEFIRTKRPEVFGDKPMELGFSTVTGQDKINLVWDLKAAGSKEEAKVFSEELFNLLSSADAEERMSEILKVEASNLPAGVMENITIARNLAAQGQEIKMMENLSEFGYERGIVAASLDDKGGSIVKSLSDQGIELENEIFATNYRIHMERLNMTGETGTYTNRLAAFSPVYDTSAVQIAGTGDELNAIRTQINLTQGTGDVGVQAQIRMADELEAEGIGQQIIQNVKRRRTGVKAGSLVDLYNTNKKNLGFAALGIAAAGIGYYMSKRHRENALYEETLAQQPLETNSEVRPMNADIQSAMSRSPNYSNPLATANVVGNLDRMKIGHTKMGNNKNSHLFGVQ
jgi:hypothetical protein